MRHLPTIARVLMGLVFVGAGLAGLINMGNPPPADAPENLKTFFTGIMATKYFFPLLKVTEVVCGALLISGFFVPLALVVLAPIILNIFLTHAFMAPQGLVLAVILGAIEIYLSFFSPYSAPIKALFVKKVGGKKK
jgi:uncharacterized membrane protein YphA (DoxX/SURF4 family)